MTTFNDFGLSQALTTSLDYMNYKEPTPIQAKAIPFALDGRDVLGTAQTGTGKTAAFSIPMVEAVLQSDDRCALVLTPTRELAKQVLDVVHQLLGPKAKINTAFIIGGDSMDKQMAQLRRNPRIVVGTPGRVNDHLKRKTLKLNRTDFLVLDETDRMLDMGFGVQLDAIAEFLPEKRQTLMFSATMPKGITRVADKYLDNPERVEMGGLNTVAAKIEQEEIRIEQPAKYDELKRQLDERMGSVIVFVKTKHGADKMAVKLKKDGHTADALHGDLRQRQRDKVMRNFRDMKFRVLIATDIAARGLDVPHIQHVINYDLPQVAEDYIHRMGRTARAGAEGSAVSFIASHDSRQWYAIECLLNPEAAHKGGAKVDGKGGKQNRRKPFRNKSGGDKRGKPAYGNKPKWEGGRKSEKTYGEHKKHADRPQSDRPKSDRPRSERSSADQRDGERANGKFQRNDRPGSEKRTDRSKAGKPSYGKKSSFDKNRSDKPKSDKPRSERPGTDKAKAGKFQGKKSAQGKSFNKGKPNKSNRPQTNSGDKALKRKRSPQRAA